MYRKQNSELALLLPTSGSTGNSKVVRLSYENIYTNTVSICEYMKLNQNDCIGVSLPLSYTYGLSLVHTSLFSGGSVFLTDKSIVTTSFWKEFNQFGVTVFAGVPYNYQCMMKLKINMGNFPKLRLLVQAGGHLSNECQQYFGEQAVKSGKEFLVMYGQTEATARISYLPADKCLEKPGSVGIAIPYTRISLIDERGQLLTKPFSRGEIIVQGKHISMGYAEHVSDLSKGNCRKGVLYTGDMGYMDEEGYLYICGRKSRFAKIYGKRISLDDVEKKISEIIGDEAVIFSNDKEVVVCTEFCVKKEFRYEILRQYPVLRKVINFIDIGKIPRKKNGKVDYIKLEAQYGTSLGSGKEN